MPDPSRIFAVASDQALVDLINSARTRLIVIAPALTKSVADALSRRLDDLGRLSVTVILDADPEVYRLGFGDEEALDGIRRASAKNLFDLREQPGVRIGVVISDTTTMVYSPVSQNVEAGSTTVEKPNAIVPDWRGQRSYRIGRWNRYRRKRSDARGGEQGPSACQGG